MFQHLQFLFETAYPEKSDDAHDRPNQYGQAEDTCEKQLHVILFFALLVRGRIFIRDYFRHHSAKKRIVLSLQECIGLRPFGRGRGIFMGIAPQHRQGGGNTRKANVRTA
ncbi:hypothetical protein [Thalassospira sp. MBR-102]|uniref:hypothetical protein n=1 Tax=Thalassospira sp. MBR-102 TaxID=3156466 RepID=UPI003393BE2C